MEGRETGERRKERQLRLGGGGKNLKEKRRVEGVSEVEIREMRK